VFFDPDRKRWPRLRLRGTLIGGTPVARLVAPEAVWS